MTAAGSKLPFTVKVDSFDLASSDSTPSTPLIASFRALLQPSQQLCAPLNVPLETCTGFALGGSTVPLSSFRATVLLSIVPQKPAAASFSRAFTAAASLATVNVSVPLAL